MVEDGLDDAAFQKVEGWSVSELREWSVDDRTVGEEIRAFSPGPSSERAAAAVKLMSNMDLVLAAWKIRVVVRCDATLGLAGRMSSCLPPKHPTDRVDGVLAAVKDGLSFGNGDAGIGVNPSTGNLQATIGLRAQPAMGSTSCRRVHRLMLHRRYVASWPEQPVPVGPVPHRRVTGSTPSMLRHRPMHSITSASWRPMID